MKKNYNNQNEDKSNTLQEAVRNFVRMKNKNEGEKEDENVSPDDFAFGKLSQEILCFYVQFENGVKLYIPISDDTLAPYRRGEEHMIQYEHDYKRFYIWYDSYAVEIKDMTQCTEREQWLIERVDCCWKDVLEADKILETFKGRNVRIFKNVSHYYTHHFGEKKLRPHFSPKLDVFFEYMEEMLKEMKKCSERSDLKGFTYTSMELLFMYTLRLHSMGLPLTPLWNDFFHSMMYDENPKTSFILDAWFDEMDELDGKTKDNKKPS